MTSFRAITLITLTLVISTGVSGQSASACDPERQTSYQFHNCIDAKINEVRKLRIQQEIKLTEDAEALIRLGDTEFIAILAADRTKLNLVAPTDFPTTPPSVIVKVGTVTYERSFNPYRFYRSFTPLRVRFNSWRRYPHFANTRCITRSSL